LKVSPLAPNAEIDPIPYSATSTLDWAKLEAADAIPLLRAHLATA